MTGPTDDVAASPAHWHPAPMTVLIVMTLVAALALLAVVLRDEHDDAAGAGATPAAADPLPAGGGGSPASGTSTSALSTTTALASWQDQFLQCVARRESGDDATAVGPGGQAFGSYQITPQTWDATAQHYGWNGLVGIRPDQASAAQQYQVAMGLVEWQGYGPWGGGCAPTG